MNYKNLKYTCLSLLAFFMLMRAAFAAPYIITGKIEGHDNQLIYLSIKVTAWNTVTDSILVRHGQFSFKGDIAEPAPASIAFDGKDALNIFLDGANFNVTISDKLAIASVTGSTENYIYTAFNKAITPYKLTEADVTWDTKYEAAKDSINLEKLHAAFNEKAKNRVGVVKTFVQKYPDSKAVAYEMIVYLSDSPYKELRDVYQGLSARIKDSGYGRYLQRRINKLSKTAVGQKAEDFTETDANGKTVSLSAYKGKYVLIDFWASWCDPCRLANPHLVDIYHKYNPLGFDIISIALEQPNGDSAWRSAIAKDQLSWASISDLKYFNSKLALLYGVSNIPSNILIDPDGIIIAHNLEAGALDKKLNEILHEKK